MSGPGTPSLRWGGWSKPARLKAPADAAFECQCIAVIEDAWGLRPLVSWAPCAHVAPRHSPPRPIFLATRIRRVHETGFSAADRAIRGCNLHG